MQAFLNNRKLVLRNPKAKRPWQHVLEPLAGYILLAQKLYGKRGFKFSGTWNFGPKRQNFAASRRIFISKKTVQDR